MKKTKKIHAKRLKRPSAARKSINYSFIQHIIKFRLLLRETFADVDVGMLTCTEYIDCFLQNDYYEGYTQKVLVLYLFIYDFNGIPIHAVLNYPGFWHERKLA